MEYRNVPVGELADLLHPSASRWKALAMLRAYFDASSTEIQSGVSVLAGYVATKSAWERLEPLWLGEVAKVGIPRFHRTDLKQWLGYERGELCIRQFAQLIRPIIPDAVHSAVVDDDWDALDKPAAFAARFPSSLHFCFEHVIWQLSHWGKDHAPGEPIAPVFDDDMSKDAAAAIFEEYKASAMHPNIVGSITWGHWSQHRMLETADLAAGELQAYWFDQEYPPLEFKPQFPVQLRAALAGKAYRDSGLWTALPLQVAVKDFIERGDAFFLPDVGPRLILPSAQRWDR